MLFSEKYESDSCLVHGSITIFLTGVFLLFFSMIGVMFESARVLSSDGYMKVAARSAAMTVFGNYNKELYEEYGLWAYGGYDGIGATELNAEFLGILGQNLLAAPAGKERQYSDLYRFRELDSVVESEKVLTEKEIFYEQIEGYLKHNAVESIGEEIAGKISGENDSDSIKDKLAIVKDYEDGKYNEMEEKEDREEKVSDGEEPDASGDSKEKMEDVSGGNPLKAFSTLAGKGVLSLVCDESTVSSGSIEIREHAWDEQSDSRENRMADLSTGTKEKGAADYLGEMLDEQPDTGIIQTSAKKVELLLYGFKQFANYTSPLDKTTKYGLEYLAAGKEQEEENLVYIVNRLLAIRLLVNLGYVGKDPVLQEKSLATATALAGFTGLPPVISAVQYTILMILAFEEACVDVTALLEGRQVPLLKNAGNFKMRYEEICMASRSLFQKKASGYEKGDKKKASFIHYRQYLWMFLLFKEEETIRNRMGDLIQYDLRVRCNQTFTIDTCICQSTFQVVCRVPNLFPSLPLFNRNQFMSSFGIRTQEVVYGYKSK